MNIFQPFFTTKEELAPDWVMRLQNTIIIEKHGGAIQ